MRSHTPQLGLEYLLLEGRFPTEGGWIGDDPDPDKPPGRELIEVVLEGVDPSLPDSELWVEEAYGWSFNCKSDDVTVNVLVQFVDHWLVIVHAVTITPRLLRGGRYGAAVLEIARRIHRALQQDERTERLTWMTTAEYTAASTALRTGG
jgi:hypothetical protein